MILKITRSIDLRFYFVNFIVNTMFFRCLIEVKNGILSKCPVESRNVNIIGSCLNISLGKGPENVYFDMDNIKFIEILELMINVYLNKENKDYLGTVLMISLKAIQEDEGTRKLMRHHFLSFSGQRYN